MESSIAICNVIKHLEHLRLTPYKDVAGLSTVGYGHRGNISTTITLQQAEALFENDREQFDNQLNRILGNIEISQTQYDALFSFVWNLGIGSLKRSTLFIDVQKGDTKAVMNEFMKWANATINGKLQRVTGLLKRRDIERAIYGSSEYNMKISTSLFDATIRQEIETLLIKYAQDLFDEFRIKIEIEE